MFLAPSVGTVAHSSLGTLALISRATFQIGFEDGSGAAASAGSTVSDCTEATRFIFPVRATSAIALTRKRRPILGIIDQPISRERWVGLSGRPTTLNGAIIRCRPCAALAAATLFATAPDMFKANDAASFTRVSAAVKLTRFGADCYAYGLVAAGFVDLVLEASLKPHDFCAMVPIVEGAGGVVTDWRGGPLNLDSDGRVLVAGDPRVHRAALELIDG